MCLLLFCLRNPSGRHGSNGAHCDRAAVGGASTRSEKDPGFFAALRMTQKGDTASLAKNARKPVP